MDSFYIFAFFGCTSLITFCMYINSCTNNSNYLFQQMLILSFILEDLNSNKSLSLNDISNLKARASLIYYKANNSKYNLNDLNLINQIINLNNMIQTM